MKGKCVVTTGVRCECPGDDDPGPCNSSLLWEAFRARQVSGVAGMSVDNVGNRFRWPSASVFASDLPIGL